MILQISTSVLNLSNQSPNSKSKQVWRKNVTLPLEASSQESSSSEQPKVLKQLTSLGEVRFEGLETPNPHRKSQLGGEVLSYIQVSILSPFVLVLVSF